MKELNITSFAKKDIDVVVIGGANWDYLIKGSHLPKPGQTVQAQTFFEWAGGKGANQAVATARLGASVALVSKVGNDQRGKNILDILKNEGVKTSYILSDNKTDTGIALIQIADNGEKQISVSPGANNHLTGLEIKRVQTLIERARILLIQLEVPMGTVQTAIEIAAASNTMVILDPAPARELPESLLEMVDIIKPNCTEAEVLTSIPTTNRHSAKAAAQTLLEQGVKTAIVQAGHEGDLLLGQNDFELWLPQIPVHGVDATGAGDAFLGALAAFLSQNRSLEESAQLAHMAAALKTRSLGAQSGLPKRLDLEKFAYNQNPTKESSFIKHA